MALNNNSLIEFRMKKMGVVDFERDAISTGKSIGSFSCLIDAISIEALTENWLNSRRMGN